MPASDCTEQIFKVIALERMTDSWKNFEGHFDTDSARFSFLTSNSDSKLCAGRVFHLNSEFTMTEDNLSQFWQRTQLPRFRLSSFIKILFDFVTSFSKHSTHNVGSYLYWDHLWPRCKTMCCTTFGCLRVNMYRIHVCIIDRLL